MSIYDQMIAAGRAFRGVDDFIGGVNAGQQFQQNRLAQDILKTKAENLPNQLANQNALANLNKAIKSHQLASMVQPQAPEYQYEAAFPVGDNQFQPAYVPKVPGQGEVHTLGSPYEKGPLVQNITNEPPYKIQPGFMLKDPEDYTKGVTPVPGSGADEVSSEAASKAQMLRTSKRALPTVKDLVYDNDGTPNYKNIAAATLGLPGTDGRRLGAAMEFGIQAITRSETGAAMPPSEVDNTRKRFQPSVFDDKETIDLKMEMFEDFISGNLKLLDPAGRFDEERFQTELQLRKAEKGSGTGTGWSIKKVE